MANAISGCATRLPRRQCIATGLAALLLLLSAEQRAWSSEFVVVESYVGSRPGDAAKWLAPLWTEFEELEDSW